MSELNFWRNNAKKQKSVFKTTTNTCNFCFLINQSCISESAQKVQCNFEISSLCLGEKMMRVQGKKKKQNMFVRLFLFKSPAPVSTSTPPSHSPFPCSLPSAGGLVKLAQILPDSQPKSLPKCFHSATPIMALQ